jgi:hypothetical protein
MSTSHDSMRAIQLTLLQWYSTLNTAAVSKIQLKAAVVLKPLWQKSLAAGVACNRGATGHQDGSSLVTAVVQCYSSVISHTRGYIV